MSDASEARDAKSERIRHLLATEGDAVAAGTRGFNAGRYASVERLADYEALKEEARATKEDAIARLPELLAELRESVEANGGTVYVADDAADANRYVREVVADRDGERVVKSKSMTTEELELNDALEADGVEVVETDLGEWVLQVADEAPSHIVAPAIHKSREGIAQLFETVFEPDEPPETAAELTEFARERLGEQIAGADVGITGANFLVAESGTLALVTSEGNARKTAVVPDTHVAVAGVEKVIPTVEDLRPFVELIGRSATGQDITSYVSLLTPPVVSPVVDFDSPDEPLGGVSGEAGKTGEVSEASGAGEAGGADEAVGAGGAGENPDREFHLVLVDNGRLTMREDEQLRETLYCIRCSACANSCANFQSVGGHAFGGETYSGGIATGWETGIEGLETAAEFNDLCTGCTRCVNACPVKIDIPWINTVVRDRINHGADPGLFDPLVEGLTPDEEPGGAPLEKRFFGNFEPLAKLGSATAPVSNWVAETGAARLLADRLFGVDPRRELPAFSRETLRDWFDERGGSRVTPAAADREAVLYPDVYTNYVHTERGKAAVRALEALDVRVVIPAVPGSGRAPFSQGMVATAEKKARAVYAGLAEHVDTGRDVVVVEPSDLAMFRREYERLLPEEPYERLRDGSYELFEYLYGLVENGADAGALAGSADTGAGEVAYHAHCQARTLGLEPYTVAVLEELGYDVRTSEVECCGMAGSFGYKSAYYELSVDVGEPLREAFADAPTVLASGTSCHEQLTSMLEREARHPVELVAPR